MKAVVPVKSRDSLRPKLSVTFKRSRESVRRAVMYIKSTEKLKNQELVKKVTVEQAKSMQEKKEVKKHYTREEIQDAILIYFSSPRTYKLILRKKLINRLPSPRTILRHIEGYRCAPGHCCNKELVMGQIFVI